MPWRFRRSVKVLPGVKINFGKRGMSTTIGGRGYKKTYGHGQTRTTWGLPGTGISYTSVKSRRKSQVTLQPGAAAQKSSNKFSEQSRPVQIITVVVMLAIIGLCLFCSIGLVTSFF